VTYNQFITEISALCESHAMIREVRNMTPQEWLFKGTAANLPVCCFDVLSSTFNNGQEQSWSVQFFFLDKSGQEAEFETEVISDQWQIAEDIYQLIRAEQATFSVDDTITITPISDKYEDYLAGVTFTINITTQREFNGCDTPTS